VFYVFFSPEKVFREKAILKRMEKTTNGANSVINNYAAGRYIKKVIFDSTTAKEIQNPEFEVSLDEELRKNEEQLDGYYIIRTNVVGISEDDATSSFDGFDCLCIYLQCRYIQRLFSIFATQNRIQYHGFSTCPTFFIF